MTLPAAVASEILPLGEWIPPYEVTGGEIRCADLTREKMGDLAFEVWRAALALRDPVLQDRDRKIARYDWSVYFSWVDLAARVALQTRKAKPSRSQVTRALEYLRSVGLLASTRCERLHGKGKRLKPGQVYVWRVWRTVLGAWHGDGTVTLPSNVTAALDLTGPHRTRGGFRGMSAEGRARCAAAGRKSGQVRRAKKLGITLDELIAREGDQQNRAQKMDSIPAPFEIDHAPRAMFTIPDRRLAPVRTDHLWPANPSTDLQIALSGARHALERIGARVFGAVDGRAQVLDTARLMVHVPAAPLFTAEQTEFERGAVLWRLLDGCLKHHGIKRPKGWNKPGAAFPGKGGISSLVCDVADALYVRKIAPAVWLEHNVAEFKRAVARGEVRLKDFPIYRVFSSKAIMCPIKWGLKLAGICAGRDYFTPEGRSVARRIGGLFHVLTRNSVRVRADRSFGPAIEAAFFPEGMADAYTHHVNEARKLSAFLLDQARSGAWVWGVDPFDPLVQS